jgi:hypothetical protein
LDQAAAKRLPAAKRLLCGEAFILRRAVYLADVSDNRSRFERK